MIFDQHTSPILHLHTGPPVTTLHEQLSAGSAEVLKKSCDTVSCPTKLGAMIHVEGFHTSMVCM